MKTTDNSTIIKLYLKMQYLDSEVTSGEFIHTVQLPERYGKNLFNKADIIQGIQEFLDWDESDEEFDVIKFGNHWYTTNHYGTYEDYFVYKGIYYPTKILNVTIDEHNDDWVHSYLVAPESLWDAIQDDEDSEIDYEVYHYIEDEYWDLPNEVLAKEHLDLPMTLVEIDED